MTSSKKILFVTPLGVHHKVGHAGGKTLNYYLKKFGNDKQFDLAIAYLGDDNTDYRLMMDDYKEKSIFIAFKKKSTLKKGIDYFRFHVIYPMLEVFFSKYYITNNFTKHKLERLLKTVSKTFKPDVIVLEFTVCIYWIDVVKKIFPDSYTVASCHDITYLSLKRYLNAKSTRLPWKDQYYRSFERQEIAALNKYDLVVTHNFKDKKLLENSDRYTNENIDVIVPYFDTYKLDNSTEKNAIVFFGAMYRTDNIDAVHWFLETAWTKLDKQFKGKVKFIIVGGGLPESKAEQFKKYNNVEIAGFVADPTTVFSKCACFVVPLRLGAGIKVKVLEAMSTGIPVITNNVGIEGIPANPGTDYIHAEKPDEFISGIISIVENQFLQKVLAENSKKMIANNFNLLQSYHHYSQKIIGNLK